MNDFRHFLEFGLPLSMLNSYVQKITDGLREENKKPKKDRSLFRDAVYFVPKDAFFMYDDAPIPMEVFIELKERTKVIKFDCVGMHQGEAMPRYIYNHSDN